MRIGFVVNDVANEEPKYTTTRLAFAASRLGHDVWMMGVGDLSHRADGSIGAKARSATRRTHRSLKGYLDSLQNTARDAANLSLEELDVLVMRNDPAEDVIDRPWAVTSGILFAQLSVAKGVLVVNDPASLANAINKTYFQHFPQAVRPRTLISRDPDEIATFVSECGESAVIKPLQGSGGTGVFLVTGDESPNLNQIIEAVARDGYVVAQEFLPGADKGDVRLFMMNGEPLERGGTYAAFRRINQGSDLRSNMHVGAKARRAKVTDAMLDVAAAVRPKLVQDGMFLVGLDIVGSTLVEVNVFSPGGLGTCQRLYGINFADVVIDALERKVAVRSHCGPEIGNSRLATL